MKKIRKTVSVFLSVIMLFMLTAPVFAKSAKPYRDYKTYLCLGDSIAAGTCLRRDGAECVFDQTIDPGEVWGATDDDVIFRGFNYEVAPNAYHSLIRAKLASALGHDVELIQAARSGLRAVELRYLLDGVYNEYDEKNIWGNTFFHAENMIEATSKPVDASDLGASMFGGTGFCLDDLDVLDRQLKLGQQGRCTDYLEGFNTIIEERADYVEVEGYIDAIEKSDLISLNLGSNDILSFTLAVVVTQIAEGCSIPGFSAAADILKNTGNIGAAFAALVDAAEAVGLAASLLDTLTVNFRKSLDQFEENYTAIVNRIYEINPDVDIVSIGCYNPLTDFRLSEGSNFNLDAIIAPVLLRLNGFLESFTTGIHADHYFYADVSGTETYGMNLDDTLFANYLIFKVHPSLAGHRFMAEQTLKAININNVNIFGAGNVHYVRLFEQLLNNLTNNIIALFARLLGSGFVFGPVSFGK